MEVINVTQEDIDSGTRTCGFCPVALALKRVFKTKYLWVINDSWSMVDYTSRSPLPIEIQKWIRTYDSGHKVGQISFEVEVDLLRSEK